MMNEIKCQQWALYLDHNLVAYGYDGKMSTVPGSILMSIGPDDGDGPPNGENDE